MKKDKIYDNITKYLHENEYVKLVHKILKQ
jgi:hypothetical protein